jgi:uncharacterized membrane protein
MEQQYARLVKTAALGATVTATVLLIIKTLAWWHTGSVSLLGITGGLHCRYRCIFDEFAGGTLLITTC